MRRWLVALVGLVALRYYFWRITETLPSEFGTGAVLIYTFCALELFTGYFRHKRLTDLVSTSDRTPDVEANLRWYGNAGPPLIDILIPTYNESRTLLKMTIVAATRQNYPRYRVWVLDDGRRAWLSELCNELDVGYICREDRRHFKAGNLNHALASLVTSSERPRYVAVLDADCIAYPTFLERTLALMVDERVAIVQTPQHFYNPDPFQYAFDAHAVWPEEWRAISFALTSLDAKGRAGCFGTAFLARVEALEEAEGFPTDSLLEDALLSKRLGKLGWRTVYLNERLSVGRSVESLADLQRQRWRWHAGEMQMLQQDWQSFGKAPALRARLRWLLTVLAWFADPAIRLAWMVVPTSFWFTGVSIVRASTEDALSYCLPMLVAPHAARFWLSRGAIMPLGAQVAPLLLAPGRIAAGVAVLFGRREPTFFVTPKGVERRSARVHGPTLIWTASLLLALVASVIYRCSRPWSNPTAHTFLLWNAAATGLLSMLLWLAILTCIERPRYRKAERYRHRGPVLLRVEGVERECVLHDLSVSGARISLLCGAQLTDNSTLALSPELDVPVRIVRRTPSDEIGLQFLPTPEQEAALIHFVLCSSAYVPQPERWSWWNFCTIVVCRALGFRASPLDLRTDRLA